MPRIKPKLTRWFDIPNDPLQGRLLVPHLDAGDLQAIAAKTVDSKMISKGQNDQGERLIEVEVRTDHLKSREMTAVAGVLDWENHLDAEGKPMKCTAENKRLFSRDPEWMEFLNQCLAVLAQETAEAEEAARKN